MIPVGIPCVLYSNAILYVSIPGTAVITVSEPILNPVLGVWFDGEAPWNIPVWAAPSFPQLGWYRNFSSKRNAGTAATTGGC